VEKNAGIAAALESVALVAISLSVVAWGMK
jgi:hypothetical protein